MEVVGSTRLPALKHQPLACLRGSPPSPASTFAQAQPCPPWPVQLVMDVMGQLEGAYALLVKSTHYPGEVVACKRGSPLILGLRSAPAPGAAAGGAGALSRAASGEVGAGPAPKRVAAEGLECFFASDASAVVEHTKK